MKILVVDDSVEYATLLATLLRALGHEPVVAYDPGDALELVDHTIDAVLTDLHMPRMSGLQLAATIRRARGDIPIAISTTDATALGRDVCELVVQKLASLRDVAATLARLCGEQAA